MVLVVDCYKLANGFPYVERYGLTTQIQRSSCSIPSNIAEGHNRKATRAYLNHIRIALGSEAELDTQLEIAKRLSFCTSSELADIQRRRERVGRMLHGLHASLKRRLATEWLRVVTLVLAPFVLAWWWFASPGSLPPLG